ncbi:carbamoyltransferase HypF [Catellatospora sp. KI3]|uniref:carbamoyltransferase HypF n=1 Tax=Catellatospora sp. KI3 TaxID=3041620 RepID=UPI002482CA07|nr:carbamoyltransferase HypF [Catellatospora sp. KI3]MDI1465684.1 carbamoyltransferase HypF [Catellatospora sp. KI3]
MAARTRLAVRVAGIVQGVGFRPFVYMLARRLGVDGHVGNDTRGVFIEAEAAPGTLDTFLAALEGERPPLAVIDSVAASPLAPTGARGFRIVGSDGTGAPAAQVSPDAATCAACLDETMAATGRRAGYAFTNCTHCGPRFTIVASVPYDRANTTMRGFALCPTCATEYADRADRRFHAQPVCCPGCGPRLRLHTLPGSGEPEPLSGDPIATAARLLREGAIVAVKGLGGYHLAVDATHPDAAARLRGAKHREDRPFALMAAGLTEAAELVELEPGAAELLTHPARPIVLLPRRRRSPHRIAEAVAPGCPEYGVMLPYTPLHHLLLRAVARPIVLTSGNTSDEPIAYRDDDAVNRLAGLADAMLAHDRPIHTRTDDSVARVVRGRPLLLRRSRGYVPRPLTLPVAARRPILACGATLKNTFCLAAGAQAVLSHHIGDLENAAVYRSYTEGVAHLRRLLGISPELVAHDLHPQYLSTGYAYGLDEVELIGVQHHHAHIASCLAEHGEHGPVLGVAFDGLGYGDDGTLWGGEFLVADLRSYTRAGRLAPVPLPGGAAAVRQPWRMALSYLDGLGELPELPVVTRHADRWPPLRSAARQGLSSPPTSSAGRLFDAVAALLDLRDEVSYEGQAAIELERAAAGQAPQPGYPARVEEGPLLTLHGADLVRAVLADRLDGVPVPVIAARFHTGLADLIAAACVLVRERHGLDTAALSGGVFQNVVLLTMVVDRLSAAGFRVLTHSLVPPNDGGISLGQAAVAAALDR